MNSQYNISNLLFGYGIVFFPLLLLVGPLVSELFLISIVIFSIYGIIKEKNEIFYKNRFLIFFSLFYISTIYSTLANYYNWDATISSIFYFRIPLFAFSIWFILKSFDIFNKKTLLLSSLFFLIIIFDSLLQFYSGKNILGNEIVSNRISSFFGGELKLGSFIVRILPIYLIYLLMNNIIQKNKKNIFYLLIISLACYVVFLSGERTAFFLLILFFSTLFFISKFFRKFIIFITLILFALIIVLSNFKNPNKIDPAHRMFVKSYNQIIGKNIENIEDQGNYEKYKKKIFNKIYIFSHDHQGHFMLSYKIFKDHIITGTGAKGFRYLCRNRIYTLKNDDGCSTHPHNTYVQILVSNGLIGFSLLLFALFYVLKEIFL